MPILDQTDYAILSELQRDCARTVEEIGACVGLSQSPCWRRIRRMEEAGLLERRVAVLDPQRVGLGVTVIVAVRTGQHSHQWLEGFASAVATIPEIVEVYRMSGDVDYLLKILARDIADYDRVYKELIRIEGLSDVSSSFAMETLKSTTAVPLPGAA